MARVSVPSSGRESGRPRQSGGDWLDDLVALADDQLALYRRHPWLLEASLRSGGFGPNATDYFEDCLRIMAPLTCGFSTKMEAIAMITGVVSLFARTTAVERPPVAPATIFVVASPDRHPHLSAALTLPDQSSPRPDMFARTVRSVLQGLLVEDQ